jgi:radical SAM protein with 4Fe4S-binding SPASM domain
MSSKFPLAVEIEINSHCNMSCSYCPNSVTERKEQGHMDIALFDEILAQLRSFDYRGRISYHFYNEPTLSPHLDDFVARTKEALPKARIDLFSNGTLLSSEKIDNLIRCGVDKFSITEHFKGNVTLMKSAQEKNPEQFEKHFNIKTYRNIELTNRGGNVNIKKPGQSLPLKLPCFIPHSVLVITLLGHVVPCYEDYHQRHVMGHIQKDHLLTIWNSENYQNFRDTLKNGHRDQLDVCKVCNNSWVIS